MPSASVRSNCCAVIHVRYESARPFSPRSGSTGVHGRPVGDDEASVLPDGSLADRVALVTGGGTGLGRAMALALGRLGAKVAVLGRRREPLDETVATLAR